VVLGVVGLFLVSAYLAFFIVVGVAIALSYNLETLPLEMAFGTSCSPWGGEPFPS